MRWCAVDRALSRAGGSGYQLGIAAEAQAVENGNILEGLTRIVRIAWWSLAAWAPRHQRSMAVYKTSCEERARVSPSNRQ